MTTLVIDVTAEDIEEGRRDDCEHCPIALATKRALGNGFCRVFLGVMEVITNGRGYIIRSSEEVIQFVHDFDSYNDVGPFSFVITYA